MDANRRLFVGGTPSLKVRTGEDAKDWEREESEGVKKGFMRSGSGFEVEALAFIARGDGSSKSRLADHMSREQRDASWLFRVFEYPHNALFIYLFADFPPAAIV